MGRLTGVKIVLILIALALGAWNYFLRDSVEVPFLSGLSSVIVWIIVGAIIAVTIILHWAIRRRY